MKRTMLGLAAALASMVVLTGAMLPLRGSLSVATTALILVVPVVIGVVVGGFAAGVLSVVAGFLVYDYFFIKPYLTLWVGAPQNWVALGVYVADTSAANGVYAPPAALRPWPCWPSSTRWVSGTACS